VVLHVGIVLAADLMADLMTEGHSAKYPFLSRPLGPETAQNAANLPRQIEVFRVGDTVDQHGPIHVASGGTFIPCQRSKHNHAGVL